jgi:hypothetical protein
MASTLLLIDRIYIFDKNSNFFQDSTVKWGAPSLKPRQIGLYKLTISSLEKKLPYQRRD